jgi:hypothetical protein
MGSGIQVYELRFVEFMGSAIRIQMAQQPRIGRVT